MLLCLAIPGAQGPRHAVGWLLCSAGLTCRCRGLKWLLFCLRAQGLPIASWGSCFLCTSFFLFVFFNLSDICCLSLGARKHLVCQKYPLLIQNVVITVVITMSGDIAHDKHYFLFIYSCHAHAACGILVPRPGIKPRPSAVNALSPNHWTTRKFP